MMDILLRAAFIWIFFLETKDRILEELVEVFDSDDPVKKSLEPRNTESVLRNINAPLGKLDEV